MSPIIIFVVLSFQQSAIHYFIAYNNELRVPPPIKQGIAITIAAPIAPANTLEFEFAFLPWEPLQELMPEPVPLLLPLQRLHRIQRFQMLDYNS